MQRIGFSVTLSLFALVAVATGVGCPSSTVSNRRDLGSSGGPVDAGTCGVCPPTKPRCDAKTKKCGPCLTDGDCPTADICRAGLCVVGCRLQSTAGIASYIPTKREGHPRAST